jgi:hypothetical protein
MSATNTPGALPPAAEPRRGRCECASCRIGRLTGPVMVITVGVIFMLQEFTRYGMSTLWPLFLIVPGIMMAAQAMASKAGHVRR